jgi:transcriptional regulator with XRE-family HTH domain
MQWPNRVTFVWALTSHMLCGMAGITGTSSANTVGDVLRELREARDISQRKLAEMLDRDSSYVSRIEASKRRAAPDDVTRFCEALDVDDEQTNDLVRMARGSRQTQWLAVTLPERRAQLNALLAAERTAKIVRHVAPLLIPGVLQTGEVIRSIMIKADVPFDEIDERVNLRIGRRNLITRKNPAHLEVLLGEAAVRTVIGSPQLMIEQLQYLLELIELPNVEIRIVPFSAGWTAASAGSFILVESDEASDIANIENQVSGVLLTAHEDIAAIRHAADTVREMAMSSDRTKELIAKVITELENQHDNTA